MTASLLPGILRCPLHPGAGGLEALPSGDALRCRQCHWSFALIDRIPDLVLADENSGPFREREIKQWNQMAASYDEVRAGDQEWMAALDGTVRALEPQPGELVLDAACGTGLTVRRYHGRVANVVALDFSVPSLQYLRKALGHSDCVHFVRADISALPFADSTFDRVLCANAIQHLPHERMRQRTVRELARVAKVGARVVVTAHNHSIRRRLRRKPREGPRRDVQYMHAFDRPELTSLLSAALAVKSIRGAGFPLPYRLKLAPLSRRLERSLRRLSPATAWALMLVAFCQKAQETKEMEWPPVHQLLEGRA
jgi:ubiquinone/menaquinone biosynthesis C-methylase UbiE